MKCFLVDKDKQGNTVSSVQDTQRSRLPDQDVLVEVQYSALNYKDALAATGQPGVALAMPLVPGIDAVGTVVETKSSRFSRGQSVIVAHEDFGTRSFGGWCSMACVPESWCVELPSGLTALQAITLGTAGFTAAQSVDKILKHPVDPSAGPVVVSGATGGVGIFAVRLLSQLGFKVVASTGKSHCHQWLKEQGAAQTIAREQLNDSSSKPLLSAKWNAAVDTVGGNTLSTILRETNRGGMVTACGLVGGAEFPITVFPFILRGVALQGIDSAGATLEYRQALWNRLAGQWLIPQVEQLAAIVPLDDVAESVDAILKGQVVGRIVVEM